MIMRSLLNLLSMRRTITDRGNAMRTHKKSFVTPAMVTPIMRDFLHLQVTERLGARPVARRDLLFRDAPPSMYRQVDVVISPSSQAAIFSAVSSSLRAVTICSPAGVPLEQRPMGSDAAGWPVRLNG